MATSVLEMILQQSDKARQSTATVAEVGKTIAAEQVILQGEITNIYDSVAQSAGVVARQAQNANIAVQNAKVQAAQAAGVSADGASGRFIDLLKQQQIAGDEVRVQLEETNRKRNRSIFDIVSDPGGTIMDMLTLENSEQKLRGSVEKATVLTNQVIQTNNALQETFATQEALKVVSTAATADAAAQIAAAEAQILAKKSQIEGLKYNLIGIQTIQQADAITLDLLGKSQNAIQAEQTMRIQNENLRINLEQLDIQKQNRQFAIDAKNEQTEFDTFLANNIATSMKATGLAVPEGIGMKQIVAMYKAGDQSYMYHAKNGQRIKATGGQTAYVGADPAEAVEVISKFDLNLPKEMAPTVDILKQAMADPALARIDRKKDPAQWNAAYNKTVDAVVANQFASVTPGSGNPFDIGSLDVAIQNPTLAALGVTQKLLAPMAASGAGTSDPRVVLRAAATAVAKGDITSTEFSQLAVVYQQASLIHQKAIGLDRAGIIPPMAGRQYNVPMKLGSIGYGTVNLTDNTELSRWLARSLALEINPALRGEEAATRFKESLSGKSYSDSIKKYQGQQ